MKIVGVLISQMILFREADLKEIIIALFLLILQHSVVLSTDNTIVSSFGFCSLSSMAVISFDLPHFHRLTLASRFKKIYSKEPSSGAGSILDFLDPNSQYY